MGYLFKSFIHLHILSFALTSVLLLGCRKDPPSKDKDEFQYQVIRPDHFPDIQYPMESIDITKAGFELGKKLFNDPRLSIDNSIACSNCHVKGVAFTDPQHDLSLGVFDRVGIRNAPSIVNMAFQKEFFWDGGVTHLDFVPVNAIENELEMGESLANVVKKLNNLEEYRSLFKTVYPDSDSISAPLMLKSFSQYMLLLISSDSKYDQVVMGKDQFSQEEEIGHQLFETHCAQCHTPPLFTNGKFLNNGMDKEFQDLGRAIISEDEEDKGKFKVPTLRNISRTSPYMHDGRFQSLEEVLNHYATGIEDSPTLAPELKSGLPLSAEDKNHLIAFLNTLTDQSFITHPLF